MTRRRRRGAVYDRGYRPYDGPRGGRGAATLALYKASMRRALGLRRSWRQKVAPFVLLGVVTIPAIVNVGIGYVTRDQPIDRVELITYRDYVGVSSALLLFVALVAPDVDLPRPAPAGAAADVRPPADRARLRRWPRSGRSPRSCSPSRSCPRSCCSSATCSSATAPSTTSATTSTCSGRCRSPSVLLALYYAVIGVADRVADRSAHRRRRRDHRAVPRDVDLVGDHRRRGRRRLARRPAQRARPAAVPARPRLPRSASTRRRRSAASPTAGCSPSRSTSPSCRSASAVLLWRYRWVER